MEISRALLEHYLRATGWTCRPRAERPLDPEWVRGEGERMLGISAGLPQLDAIAAHHGVTYATLAFRLGLCSAAEETRREVVAWTFTADELTRDGAHQLATYARAQASMISEYVQRHLRAAGIDPAAWERARRA